jgi:hypothetical protein
MKVTGPLFVLLLIGHAAVSEAQPQISGQPMAVTPEHHYVPQSNVALRVRLHFLILYFYFNIILFIICLQ